MNLADLMKAARKFSDWEIRHDFDSCILPLAESDEDSEVLAQYAARRRKSPHFQPGKPGHNNHEYIVPEKVASAPSDLCPQSDQPVNAKPGGARCGCGRLTYIRKNGTWARHAPPHRHPKAETGE